MYTFRPGDWVKFRKGSDIYRKSIVEIGRVVGPSMHGMIPGAFDVDCVGTVSMAQDRDLILVPHEEVAQFFAQESSPGIVQWGQKNGIALDLNSVQNEGGRSGYSAAFTHPDPMDPNDRQRQRTQARAGNFPYDMDTMYGAAEIPDDAGAKRQVGYGGQLTPWFVKDDDGDIEKEAIGTPINFKQSAGGNGLGGLAIPGQSRGFAGSTKDNLDVETHWDVFGEDTFVHLSNEDLRDLQTGELRDISMGGGLAFQGLQPQANQRPADSLVDAYGMDLDEDLWPNEVRSRQLKSLESTVPDDDGMDMTLGECFAVFNPDGDEVISLLETLDWER